MLDLAEWRSLALMAGELAQISPYDEELARQHASAQLMSLVDASHVMLVIQRRLEHQATDLWGFRPVFSWDFGPAIEERARITWAWMAHEPGLASDPVLRKVAEGAGRLRAVRHRGDIPPELWAESPVRRLLHQLELEDRVNIVLPLADDLEVSFCLDRRKGDDIFSTHDVELLLAAVELLRPVALRFVRRHGFMPGQHALDTDEQDLLLRLLRPDSLDAIASEIGTSSEELVANARAVYSKAGVSDRLELLELFARGSVARPERAVPQLTLSAEGTPLPDHISEPPESPMMTRLREAIERRLNEGGQSEIGTIAKDIGMGVRTLQRQLNTDGIVYGDVVDAARRNRATLLLGRPWLTITDVALQLGYGHVSSLNRAVKRWTGKTPRQMRDALLARE